MPNEPGRDASTSTFRQTLVRVMSMQVLALLVLALLQLRYGS
jgi:hypothetical protein